MRKLLEAYVLYLFLFIPFPIFSESGSLFTYFYAIFLLFLGINFPEMRYLSAALFTLPFTLWLFVIFSISSAIFLLYSLTSFSYILVLQLFPLYLLFKLLGTFVEFSDKGLRAFLLWRINNESCWRVLAAISTLALLEHVLDYYAFLLVPAVALFVMGPADKRYKNSRTFA